MFFVVKSFNDDAGGLLVPLVVVGPSTTANRSTDGGVTWSSVTLPDNARTDIAYGAGRFVTIGAGLKTSYSDDDGATWSTGGDMTASKSWYKLGFSSTLGSGSGRFIAINNNATDTVGNYSDDGGETWTAFTLPATVGSARGGPLWNGSGFCIVINGTAYTSADGLTWSAGGAIGAAVDGKGVYDFINDEFVYPSTGGTNAISRRSTDAASWSASTTILSSTWCYGAIMPDGALLGFTASGNDNTGASADGGDNYSTGDIGIAGNWPMTCSGISFVAVSGTESKISVDGATWVAGGATSSIAWVAMGAARAQQTAPL